MNFFNGGEKKVVSRYEAKDDNLLEGISLVRMSSFTPFSFLMPDGGMIKARFSHVIL